MAEMVDAQSVQYQQAFEETVQGYLDQGYHVLTHVPVPTFPQIVYFDLMVFDIVVQKADETIIIDITSREKLAQFPGYLKHLRRVVQQIKGWHLEIITLPAPPDPALSHPADLSPRTPAQIRQMLHDAQSQLASGQIAEAFQNTWSALEAVAVMLLSTEDDLTLDDATSGSLMEALISYLYLEQTDYDLLRKGVGIRYHLSQGEAAPELDTAFVGKLIDRVTYLLNDNQDVIPPK